jgi:hypothetical protein
MLCFGTIKQLKFRLMALKKWNTIYVVAIYFIISFYFLWGVLMSNGNVPPNDWGVSLSLSNSYNVFLSSLNAWHGGASTSNPFFPFIFYLMGQVGLVGGDFVKAWSLFLLVLSGTSAYMLARHFSLSKVSSFLVGLFYMSTPITFDILVFGWIYYFLLYALLPLFIIMYGKFLNTRKLRYALTNAVLLGLILQPFFVIIYLIITLVYLIFNLSRINFLRYIWHMVIIISVSFLVNLNSLLNFSNAQRVEAFYVGPSYVSAILSQFSHLASFANVIRLWGSTFNFQFETYYPQHFLFLSFLVIPIVGLSVLSSKKSAAIFFALLYVMFVGFTYFGYYNLYFLITKIPLGFVLDQFDMLLFPAAVGIAMSIGFFAESIMDRFNGKMFKSKFFALIILLIIIFSGFSWWAGEVYGKPNSGFPDKLDLYKAPEGWMVWANQINASNKYFVLYDPYIFDSSIVNSTTFDFGLNPTMYSGTNALPYVSNAQIYSLVSSNEKNLSVVLGELGIKYIVVYTNIKPPFTPINYNYTVPQNIIENMSSQNGFVEALKMPGIVVFEDLYAKPIVYSNSTHLNIEYMSPTTYIVKTNSSSPFLIVLNQEFSEGWVTYINGKEVLPEYHYQLKTAVSGLYFNGWYINSTGTFTIKIFYAYQVTYIIMTFISQLILWFIIGGIIFIIFKERLNKG